MTLMKPRVLLLPIAVLSGIALAVVLCRAQGDRPWPPQGGFTEWGGIFLPGVSVTPTNHCFHDTGPHTFTAKAAGGKGGTYDWKYGGHSQTSTNNTAEFTPDLKKKPATLNVTFTPDGYPEASATGSATLGYCKRLAPPPEDDNGHEHDENCNPHKHWWCCKCGAYDIPDPELFPHNCDPSGGAGGGGTPPQQNSNIYLGSVPHTLLPTHPDANAHVMFFPTRRWADGSGGGGNGTNAPPYVCGEEDCGGIHSYSCCDHAHGDHIPYYGQCCPCPEHNGGGSGGGINSPLRYITSYGLIVSTNPPPDITVLQNVPGGAIIPDGTPVWVTSNDPSTTLGDCWARFAWDADGKTYTRDYTFTGIGMRLFPDRIGDNTRR